MRKENSTATLRCLSLNLLSAIVPLSLVTLAIHMAPWFNFYKNALSDLGHVLKSEVAPVFNLGLSSGGFLIGVYAVACVNRIGRLLTMVLLLVGYSLILVGVFDESYGFFHFTASVAFFLSLGLFLAVYILARRTLWPLISLAIGAVAWTLHLVWKVPKGAAIPELISVMVVLPFYLSLSMRGGR